ncbi:hypothetical protein, partial [Micromonospora sp. RTP1Z1]|uniref:hypothetical protein n=1 Tax=Micromonospora sp. RTP1Z1 TaxID=2994043 RepID=UPI0029C97462
MLTGGRGRAGGFLGDAGEPGELGAYRAGQPGAGDQAHRRFDDRPAAAGRARQQTLGGQPAQRRLRAARRPAEQPLDRGGGEPGAERRAGHQHRPVVAVQPVQPGVDDPAYRVGHPPGRRAAVLGERPDVRLGDGRVAADKREQV